MTAGLLKYTVRLLSEMWEDRSWGLNANAGESSSSFFFKGSLKLKSQQPEKKKFTVLFCETHIFKVSKTKLQMYNFLYIF